MQDIKKENNEKNESKKINKKKRERNWSKMILKINKDMNKRISKKLIVF